MAPSTPAFVLLIAKIAVSAGFVLGVTAAVERLGPRLGAFISATPQLSVVSLIFLTIEQGPAFAAESAYWTIPGMCATVPVFLGYWAATRFVLSPRAASVAGGVALGSGSFAVAIALLSAVPLTRGTVLPLAALVCGATAWLVRTLPDTAPLRRVPSSPLVLATRAAVSAVTVIAVTSLAHLLGPKWSGLILGFPVNSLPVMAILHAQYGSEVTRPFIRIFPVGAFGICLFNVVASLTLVRFGLLAALALAYAVDLAFLAMVALLARATRRG